jgi:LAS superfamily LD-carboxypeptidase LdcB
VQSAVEGGRAAAPLGLVSGHDERTFGPHLSLEQFRRLILETQTRDKLAKGSHQYDDVPADELEVVEGKHRMRRAAASGCRDLLVDARAATESDPEAAQVSEIKIISAYRDIATDRAAWKSAFATYYADTKTRREACADGGHGAAAAKILLAQLRAYKAPPGFSNHTNGNAVDFGTTENGHQLKARKAQKAAWRVTWLYRWLVANAAAYGFQQLPTEEWHWDFR